MKSRLFCLALAATALSMPACASDPARTAIVDVAPSIDLSDFEIIRQGDGDITVVFESGFSVDAHVWKGITSQLGPAFSTLAYSRLGIGASPARGDALSIAQDLEVLAALIDSLGDTKVILVGHSYGGLLATQFARAHPSRLSGLVLVDPATLSQRRAFRKIDTDRIDADDAMMLQYMPDAMKADYAALMAQMDAAAPDEAPLSANLPTVLITSTMVATEPFVFEETAEGKQVWLAQHEALFANTRRGQHIRLDDIGHNVHEEQPTVVTSAIEWIATSLPKTQAD